jgi:erythrin-vacuolar iron transport family protein
MLAIAPAGTAPQSAGGRSFLLERVQPALSGLMDGSLSTLAPIFAGGIFHTRPFLIPGYGAAIGAAIAVVAASCSSWPGCGTGFSTPASPGRSSRSPSAGRSSLP